MRSAWQQFAVGWQEAHWSADFTRAALPGTIAAFGLAALIQGRASDPPGLFAWLLEVPVLLGALYWAGLRDGPDGFLGRSIWRVTAWVLVGYSLWRIRNLAVGVHEFSFQAAGIRLAVIVTVEDPAPEQRLALFPLRDLRVNCERLAKA